MSEAGFVGRIGMGARSVTSQQFSLWRHLETLPANFVGHFVEKSNIFQNSSTKGLDKVGDEDTRTAIMRTAGAGGSAGWLTVQSAGCPTLEGEFPPPAKRGEGYAGK